MAEAAAKKVDKIISALIEVRSGCEGVSKSGYNSFHGYYYATENDISAQISPLMDSAGLVIIPSVAGEKDGFPAPFIDDHGITQVILKYTLAHVCGQVWPEPIYVLAHGDDHNKGGGYGDKGAAKANTGGFKYMLLRLLMVETGDDPDGARTPAPKSDAPPQQRSSGKTGKREEINPQQHRMLKAVSYKEAEKLDQSAYDDEHHIAGSLRKAAAEAVGIVSGDKIFGDQVDDLVAAMKRAQQSPDDGSIWIQAKGEKPADPPPTPSDPPF